MPTITLSYLRDSVLRRDGDVVFPGDAAWDEARQPWNLAVDQQPVAVFQPKIPEEPKY